MEIITASEIAQYAFCPESARLAHIGTPSANQPRLDHGTRHHAHLASSERIAGGSIALGRILIAVAALGAIAWLFS